MKNLAAAAFVASSRGAFSPTSTCTSSKSTSACMRMQHHADVPAAIHVASDAIAQSRANTAALSNIFFSGDASGPMISGIREFLVPSAFAAADKPKPPTNQEVTLLREALGAFYGERDYQKAEELLTKAIDAWQRQPPDERAALYRVRGDSLLVSESRNDAYMNITQSR